VLAHMRPSRLRFTCELVPYFEGKVLPGSMSRASLGTARCPEPLRRGRVLPAPGWRLAPSRRALPLLLRSYWLMCQTQLLRPTLLFALPGGLCRLLPAPAGRGPFPTLSLQSLYRRLDPYPVALSWCTCPLLPRRHRPPDMIVSIGSQDAPCNATSTGS